MKLFDSTIYTIELMLPNEDKPRLIGYNLWEYVMSTVRYYHTDAIWWRVARRSDGVVISQSK